MHCGRCPRTALGSGGFTIPGGPDAHVWAGQCGPWPSISTWSPPSFPVPSPSPTTVTRAACSSLHGFTGNPQSMRPLAEAVAAEGYTVELPLLPGHGTAVEDMVPTRWSDYVTAAEAAYIDLARRCDAVAVVALSMGGTLACLAGRAPSRDRGDGVGQPVRRPSGGELPRSAAGHSRLGDRGRSGRGVRHRQGGLGRARLSRVAHRRRAESVRRDRRGRRRARPDHVPGPLALEPTGPRRAIVVG